MHPKIRVTMNKGIRQKISLNTVHCYQARACCPTHRSQYYDTNTDLRKEKALLWGWLARRQEARLRSVSPVQGLVKLLWLREDGLVRRSPGGAAFNWRDWNLTIYGKVWNSGFQHQIFLDKDPLLQIKSMSFGSVRWQETLFLVLRLKIYSSTCFSSKTCSYVLWSLKNSSASC